MICLDVGDHTVWFNRLFRGTRQKSSSPEAGVRWGFGLPAALSVKLAVPERQVIAVVSDGGLAQSLADFCMAIRYQLPIKVIVFKTTVGDGTGPDGTDTWTMGNLSPHPGFRRLCPRLRGKGYTVNDAAELDPVWAMTLSSPEPTIVQIHTAAPSSLASSSQLTRENKQQEREN